MEAAITPVAPQAVAIAFPSMRGMAATPAPEGPQAVMRGMAPVSVMDGPARFAEGKNAMRAFALSLVFPGGGQFYNGDIKKGFLVLGLALLAYCMMLYAGLVLIGAPLSIGNWLWSLVDARKVALRQKALW